MPNKHLFIVCMNNGGSTLLQHCLGSCKSIVELPRVRPAQATSSEGHNHVGSAMPYPRKHGVIGVWTEKPNVFGNNKNYNWKKIKEKWFKGWEKSADKPLENMVLLEKSPPNVIRASLLQNIFLIHIL